MLLTRLWERDRKRHRSPDGPPASALLLGYESERVRASRALSSWLAGQSPNVAAEALASGATPEPVSAEDWASFQQAFQRHLDTRGRTILALDFASPTSREEPQAFLMTMKHWLEGGGTDPRVRRLLLELGPRLGEAGGIETSSDVFWLEETELREDAAALDARSSPPPRAQEIRRRKALWRSRKRATPPGTVPYTRSFMGLKVADFVPEATERESGLLKGIGASGGRVTAPARVLRGAESFAGIKAGEVLIADITTPAWTPLFALAAAVVTDIGGPLSHGSIVDREYGIPAVLGTGTATRRVRDGDILTVDGDAGTVRWEERLTRS
jgi:pyruvate,water dikinase